MIRRPAKFVLSVVLAAAFSLPVPAWAGVRTAKLVMPDVICATSCILVEALLKKQEGLSKVAVDQDGSVPYATVTFDDEVVRVEEIIEVLEKEGYRVESYRFLQE